MQPVRDSGPLYLARFQANVRLDSAHHKRRGQGPRHRFYGRCLRCEDGKDSALLRYITLHVVFRRFMGAY